MTGLEPIPGITTDLAIRVAIAKAQQSKRSFTVPQILRMVEEMRGRKGVQAYRYSRKTKTYISIAKYIEEKLCAAGFVPISPDEPDPGSEVGAIIKKQIDENEQAVKIASQLIGSFQEKYPTKAAQAAHLGELIGQFDAHPNPLVKAAAPRLAREYQPMTIEEAGNAYREAQAQKMMDLFEDAKGRPARTVEELSEWLASPEGKRATAYDRDPEGKIIP